MFKLFLIVQAKASPGYAISSKVAFIQQTQVRNWASKMLDV